jgi:hypothetical protein
MLEGAPSATAGKNAWEILAAWFGPISTHHCRRVTKRQALDAADMCPALLGK